MAVVVDASVTMAWLIDGEATPYTESMLSRLEREQAHVPSIWRYEIANALLVAERRGRISQAQSLEAIERVVDLAFIVEDELTNRIWPTVINLARDLQLSVYDASYVDLAAHQGMPLATIDNKMRTAAARFGVELAEAE